MFDLTNEIYTDENKAREHLEAIRWPTGPYCPHCGETENVHRLEGKSTRPGLLYCRSCRGQFSVTVGTVFERSKISLNKWLLCNHLLCASKKGMSAHEIHRLLGVTYKTAWFMCHRIREAMNIDVGPLGGSNKVVEVDETYVGGKAGNRATRAPAPKKAVVSLVERDGKVASYHVANVTAKKLRPLVVQKIDRASHLMTDESGVYTRMGREFAGHSTVNHSKSEYVSTGGFKHSNTVENFFSIFKRGIIGTYHHMSEAHLARYCAEFDFRYNHKSVSDCERADEALKGITGKRLTYRRSYEAANA